MTPNIRNFAAFITGLRRLAVAVKENAAVLPDVTAELATLETALTAAEDAKSRQDALRGDRQAATQGMRTALEQAQNAAFQLQSAAKFKLGSRNEKLSSFQVVPLRKRGARQSAKLKAQEEALKTQEAELQKQDNDLLKKEVELLKKEGPAAAS